MRPVVTVSVRRSPWALQALWAAFFSQVHDYVRRKQQLALDRVNGWRRHHGDPNPPVWYLAQAFYRKCGEVRTLLRRRYSYRLLNPDLL